MVERSVSQWLQRVTDEEPKKKFYEWRECGAQHLSYPDDR